MNVLVVIYFLIIKQKLMMSCKLFVNCCVRNFQEKHGILNHTKKKKIVNKMDYLI